MGIFSITHIAHLGVQVVALISLADALAPKTDVASTPKEVMTSVLVPANGHIQKPSDHQTRGKLQGHISAGSVKSQPLMRANVAKTVHLDVVERDRQREREIDASGRISSPLLQTAPCVPVETREQLYCSLKQRWPIALEHDILPKSFKSCAVVSNSGALMEHSFGAEIDLHEAIFRMNGGAVKGFEDIVGARESIRVVNGEEMKEWKADKQSQGVGDPAYVVLHNAFTSKSPAKKTTNETQTDPLDVDEVYNGLLKIVGGARVSGIKGGLNFDWTSFQELFRPEWFEHGIGDYPSSGFFTMLLALSLCENVDAYEMVPSKASENEPFHYFGSYKHYFEKGPYTYHKPHHAERRLWELLSTTSTEQTYKTGKARLVGFQSINCRNVVKHQGSWHTVTGEFEGFQPRLCSSRQASTIQPATQPGVSVSGESMIQPDAKPCRTILAFEIVVVVFAVGFFLFSWRQELQNVRGAVAYPNEKFVALFAYLVLVICTDLATKREADRLHGKITLKPLVIVLCVESGKLLTSVCMELRGRSDQTPQASWHEIRNVGASLTPVAFTYAANNTLTFVLLATTFLDTYVTWRNMSIVFSSLMWMMTFQKMMPLNRVGAVFLVFIGCWCNSLHMDWEPATWGILASTLLSVAGSVLNERALKAPEHDRVGINVLNILMYAQTVLVTASTLAVIAFLQGSLNHASVLELCRSMTAGTLLVIVCQVSLGIVISRVLKHADSVTKTMVGSLKEVMVVGIGYVVVDRIHKDQAALGGSVIASVACLVYFAKERVSPLDKC